MDRVKSIAKYVLIAPILYVNVLIAEEEFLELSLEDLLNIKVTSVSKEAQKQSEAPAVVSVITRSDINNWGYKSVADALVQVPGFYGVDDYVSVNFGVRGSNGGLRAYSRNLKVMINGQSIAFRSDSANYLGEELISMEAVERIEVVRGPASALYGENAFLGIINIITRSASENWDGDVKFRLDQDADSAISGWVAYSNEQTQFNFAYSAANDERDGNQLPSTSPLYASYLGANNLESVNDKSKPENIYLETKHQFSEQVNLEFMYHQSTLDSYAEFLDFGILSHENRLSIESETIRVKGGWAFSDNLEFNVSLTKAEGNPSDNERLSFGSDTSFPRRKFSYDANDWSLEGRYSFSEKGSITFGYDVTDNDEELLEIFNVAIDTGEETLVSAEQGIQNFENKGTYVQFVSYPTDSMGITLNVRRDDHNIYGASTNYRAGVVYVFSDELSIKGLYGTSFKAPAAMQLFAQPLYAGEVIGNPNLRAEDASTFEVELNWTITKSLGLVLNAYDNEIEDRVELVPVGNNNQPQNVGNQKGRGVEGELRYVYSSSHIFAGNFSYTDTENTVNDPIFGAIKTASDMYPKLTSQIRWQWLHSPAHTFGLSGRYISERRATRSNIQLTNDMPYQLDAYFVLDASYNYRLEEHQLGIKVQNILDESYEDPGFSGIDVPGREREVYASYSYSF
ncbi:TonB-dependent siderophore receptor [Pleionea sp. CnH1-48]|uniref:TonB-dependent receptor plug domain-containing protein n=1 Tax=Pleionea sp. CnH1-48 TaxID=2954494 RepID=UPI00209762C8|nr:TonB-dependent receptor [Pleionea sp. CnH1-48]MCO7225486.1 TonB-dependent receptor [Pleionea sp. CnH1-48]